jgi:hypothetical protein
LTKSGDGVVMARASIEPNRIEFMNSSI